MPLAGPAAAGAAAATLRSVAASRACRKLPLAVATVRVAAGAAVVFAAAVFAAAAAAACSTAIGQLAQVVQPERVLLFNNKANSVAQCRP